MKKILVPTDFSRQAEHAARFAMFLARKFKAEVILHHSYVIPVYATDLPVALPSDTDLEKASQEGLTSLKTRLIKDFPDVPIATSVTDGFAEESVPRAAADRSADLVVMGTRGASGLREALIGTITASVMERSVVPVIAVPEDAEWMNFDKILFATSYEEGDFGHVEEVVDFAMHADAEVILLHVSSGKYDKTYEFDAIERFTDRLRQDTGYDKISFKLMDDDDIFEGISRYAEEVRADMIAMTMRHRTLFGKLFQRSLTKRMAFHTHVPLMAFQSDKS